MVPGIFKKTSEWVHIAWVKQGSELRFYRNGQKVHTFPNAPAEIELSDKYNIGHNDNFFVGNIGEVLKMYEQISGSSSSAGAGDATSLRS